MNSAYHHRTHLNLVDITVMNCVNSKRVILVSTQTTELNKVWTQLSNFVYRLRRKLFVTEETLYSYITFNQPNLVINVSYTCFVWNFIKISSFSFPSILKLRFDFPTGANVFSFAIMSDPLSHISSRELGNSYDA